MNKSLHVASCDESFGHLQWKCASDMTLNADAHRGDGKRFVVRGDEKLSSFVDLESAIRVCGNLS